MGTLQDARQLRSAQPPQVGQKLGVAGVHEVLHENLLDGGFAHRHQDVEERHVRLEMGLTAARW